MLLVTGDFGHRFATGVDLSRPIWLRKRPRNLLSFEELCAFVGIA